MKSNMNTSAPLDFTVVCRLCLKPGDSKKICEMPYYMVIIHKLTNIMVHNDDVLPKNICNECCVKLDEISQFIEMCNENNSYINALHISKVKEECTEFGELKNPKIEIIDVENEDQKMCNINEDYSDTKGEWLDISSQDNNTDDDEFNVTDCSLCPWIGKDLKEHQKEHIVASRKWKCVDCEQKFDRKYDLILHRPVHTGEKLFVCEICGMSFNQIDKKKRHTIAKHPIVKDKFECYICGQNFERKEKLETHILGKHIEKSVWNNELGSGCICKICGKSFSLPSYLEDHSVMHVGKKLKQTRKKTGKMKVSLSQSSCRFECDICGKSFSRKETYMTHMRVKHCDALDDDTKGTYQCWLCGKIFHYLSSMKQHVRIHTGEKPYKCEICGKKFARSNTLRDHERTHTGIKPHTCKLCHKSFVQRTALVTHMKSAFHKKGI